MSVWDTDSWDTEKIARKMAPVLIAMLLLIAIVASVMLVIGLVAFTWNQVAEMFGG